MTSFIKAKGYFLDGEIPRPESPHLSLREKIKETLSIIEDLGSIEEHIENNPEQFYDDPELRSSILSQRKQAEKNYRILKAQQGDGSSGLIFDEGMAFQQGYADIDIDY